LTFARFVSVPENRSGLLAVQGVAAALCSRRRQRAPNPLYLHGPAGTGKTHLVAALIADVTRRASHLVIANLPAGDFATLVDSSREAQTEEFGTLESARESDLVVVEDVQYLPARSVEAFGQLFDDLLVRRVQMVFTACTGPRGLDLPARLKSRLAGGLVVGLEPLQQASRLALLEDKAQRQQLAISRDVLAWLAQRLTGGGRQLEGALARLETLSRIERRLLDVPTVASYLQEQLETARPTVEQIVERVSGQFHVEPKRLQSSQRGRNVLLPRQVSMYLARQLTSLSLEQIGAYFGGRDHSTVLHACRKVEQALVSDSTLSGTIRQLRSDLV
jgi:chromosomal replication initiator protein